MTKSTEPDKHAKPNKPRPTAQLPKGRYPASPATIWVVTALVVLNCAILALGIR